jgi:inhibitor of KinA sporulation pathway (predicted exonuclease)
MSGEEGGASGGTRARAGEPVGADGRLVKIVNVIDVEATCWEGEPPAGQMSEIIEVGLCVLDLDARERLERRAILVRPDRSEVGEFCTRLTGLSAAEVAGGVSFAEACAELEKEFASGRRLWASWGDYDRKQFQAQCAATGVHYPFGARHVNAKAAFTADRQLRKRPGMAQALALAGLPLEGRHHRGVDDAWNIAALILDTAARGGWPADGTPA